MNSLSPEALAGFANSAAYDTYRPSYPPAAVTQLLTALRIANKPRARVLDLAAGTGKFTQLLAARPERFEITAVEPHDDMRRELERKGLRGVTVCKGAAEGIPARSGEFDAVICAQVCCSYGFA
jgi:ubiquinone/menaquinone biosynthesis C-methylase UbiE